MAKFVAIVVRNQMEDFRVKHLSDAQMKELNPIIRNAICTALHAASNCQSSKNANEFVQFHLSIIPSYWEEPEIDPILRAD